MAARPLTAGAPCGSSRASSVSSAATPSASPAANAARMRSSIAVIRARSPPVGFWAEAQAERARKRRAARTAKRRLPGSVLMIVMVMLLFLFPLSRRSQLDLRFQVAAEVVRLDHGAVAVGGGEDRERHAVLFEERQQAFEQLVEADRLRGGAFPFADRTGGGEIGVGPDREGVPLLIAGQHPAVRIAQAPSLFAVHRELHEIAVPVAGGQRQHQLLLAHLQVVAHDSPFRWRSSSSWRWWRKSRGSTIATWPSGVGKTAIRISSSSRAGSTSSTSSWSGIASGAHPSQPSRMQAWANAGCGQRQKASPFSSLISTHPSSLRSAQASSL